MTGCNRGTKLTNIYSIQETPISQYLLFQHIGNFATDAANYFSDGTINGVACFLASTSKIVLNADRVNLIKISFAIEMAAELSKHLY